MLKSASKKWKDFKVVLKRKYFNPKLTRKQNIRNGCGKRLPRSTMGVAGKALEDKCITGTINLDIM